MGSCLVVRSSARHYHLIFDNRISWERIVSIIETLAQLHVVEKNYLAVSTFRRDLTLRVSPKRGVDRIRPPPEPVEIINDSDSSPVSYGIPRYLLVLATFNNPFNFNARYQWTKR